MRRSAVRGAAVSASVLLVATLAGCSTPPRALHLGQSGIEQDVPLALYPAIWMGIPLDNRSNAPITLQAIAPTGLRNLRAGRAVVIELQPDGSINWYPPPGTKSMRAEMAASTSVAGFTIPAHTTNRYQAVIPLTARSRTATASTTGATVTYISEGHTWHETLTEHDALKN